MKNEFLIARFEGIVVQELKDEVLVCDTKDNRVFCLNQTAGEVWKLCDGENDVAGIAKYLSRKLKSNVSEELVLFSLDELSKQNLLERKIDNNEEFAGLSRRQVIKRIGLGSMIALPVISSVVMPTAAHAQSGCSIVFPIAQNCPCTLNDDCDLGLFCSSTNDTCQPTPNDPCVGEIGGSCPAVGFCCPERLFCCNPGVGDSCSSGC